MELAEKALKDIISPDQQKEITPEYIISVVAEHYHVTTADLCGNKRSSKNRYAETDCHVFMQGYH